MYGLQDVQDVLVAGFVLLKMMDIIYCGAIAIKA